MAALTLSQEVTAYFERIEKACDAFAAEVLRQAPAGMDGMKVANQALLSRNLRVAGVRGPREDKPNGGETTKPATKPAKK